MITGNEPAMPCDIYKPNSFAAFGGGLTIRQHFAATAMQGYLAGSIDAIGHGMIDNKDVAKFAVNLADALIAELNATL